MVWFLSKDLAVDLPEDAELAPNEFSPFEGEEGLKCLLTDAFTDLCPFALEH